MPWPVGPRFSVKELQEHVRAMKSRNAFSGDYTGTTKQQRLTPQGTAKCQYDLCISVKYTKRRVTKLKGDWFIPMLC